AMGASADAQLSYRAAARYPTAYYGQLARSRLGLEGIELRPPSSLPVAAETPPQDARVRAADIYRNDERQHGRSALFGAVGPGTEHGEQFAAHAHRGDRRCGRAATRQVGLDLQRAGLRADADDVAVLHQRQRTTGQRLGRD
ncbi:hypothetical protein KXW38_002276, partial [Aspergillus fumigatus]